jgi:hypothetical protein
VTIEKYFISGEKRQVQNLIAVHAYRTLLVVLSLLLDAAFWRILTHFMSVSAKMGKD